MIDLHQHLWPEELIRALERRRDPPRLRGSRLELAVEGAFDVDLGAHELDARLALLDRHELETAVVSLAPTMETEGLEELEDAYHEGVAALAAAAGGRLVALAAREPRDGFAGVCISAARLTGGAETLLSRLAAEGGFLFVHPGPPSAPPAGAPSWWAPAVDYTAQMQAAYLSWLTRDAARFPSVPVVFAILAGGGPFQLERLRSRGGGVQAPPTNVFLETSSYGTRALELCAATHGAAQLVFGSDAPVLEPETTLRAVRELDEATQELLLETTPAHLLASARQRTA